MSQKISAITGAFSYTGRYVTQILQQQGVQVRNLTNHPSRPVPKNQINKDQIDVYPLNYDDVNSLSKSLEGADTLYCTYWVRFNDYKGTTREQGIQRAKNIIQAAKNVGIQKIIYTSHTQSSLESPFAYINGKAQMEEYIKESGISYGFAKPCMIFGDTPQESIVANNCAYLLRKLPIFLIPGQGNYPVQPVHVRDMAQLMVKMAEDKNQNQDFDAVGPEIFTYNEFIQLIQDATNSKVLKIKGLNTDVVHKMITPVEYLLKDKFIEKDDLDLLTNNYLHSKQPPTGSIKFSEWVYQNREQLGKRYINSTDLYYTGETTIFDKVQKI
ncbi:hypothetical protein PPERSA_01681 [Pseudocohnilembus persalinus]|uniref:NmrA-like domain-containing protein n=1 Tax=Pseudocohnilembus persalinus TaxID=266149 RepID=A0A0V0R1U0_PSEPJ|nr:hypothetical protein PPERSA_01681 [Pseudocohnilembus persalinus]|eukprot:KRX08136.1 hypothetical protein PPERSA_01681 [Pseudocohnilembus persalinus]